MKKKEEGSRTHEATPSAMSAVTMARAEMVASRSPVMKRAPQSSVAEPQQKVTSMGQQTPEPLVLVAPMGGPGGGGPRQAVR